MHSLPNIPPAITHEVFATLCATLPAPIADTPEGRAARDETAVAAVAALLPANAFEARLASEIVSADAHAMDCLRLAVQPGESPEAVRRNRARASAMLRHVQSGLRALLRIQAMREKAEAAMHPAAMERAGYWFHDVSIAAPEPPPAPPDFSTEAESYAAANPERAARIRAQGGLPMRLDFSPPPSKIVETLISGTSPILGAPDHVAPS